MARFINPFPQYINIAGSPINGGFLEFFDTGTSDAKVVYSDANLTQSIGSVVRLDGSGRVPAVFLNGAYAVTLTDADGNEIDSADPIGIDTDITNFDDWGIANTYNIPDIVTGSDNLFYQSIVDTNLGNDPTAQPSAFWEQFFFMPTWNTAQTYSSGMIVIASNGRTYSSQLGSNQGNDPTLDSGVNWEIIVQNMDDLDISSLIISKTGAIATSLSFQSDDLISWVWDFDSDENMSLDRYIAGALQDTVLSINNATGALTIVSDVGSTGDFTINSGDLTVDTGDIIFSQDGNATFTSVALTSDISQTNQIAFQDATIDRWVVGQNNANNFSLVSFNSSGLDPQTIFFVNDGETDINVQSGNIIFPNTAQGIDVGSANGGALNFNFTGVDTDDTAFDFFDNTTTTGERLFNIYQGDGTSTITCQINAETGSIYPAFDRAGESDIGVKLGKITLSTDAPTGGEDGDLWLRY